MAARLHRSASTKRVIPAAMEIVRRDACADAVCACARRGAALIPCLLAAPRRPRRCRTVCSAPATNTFAHRATPPSPFVHWPRADASGSG